METPIARKKNNHPRDFILTKPNRYGDLSNKYSFNDQPSISSSKDMGENNVNPEEMLEERLMSKKNLRRAYEINVDAPMKRYRDHVEGEK